MPECNFIKIFNKITQIFGANGKGAILVANHSLFLPISDPAISYRLTVKQRQNLKNKQKVYIQKFRCTVL